MIFKTEGGIVFVTRDSPQFAGMMTEIGLAPGEELTRDKLTRTAKAYHSETLIKICRMMEQFGQFLITYEGRNTYEGPAIVLK